MGDEGGEKMNDPVCNMKIGENSKFKSSYKGRTYYFCSASCKQNFDKNPENYVGVDLENKYQCSICKLHYKSNKLADECHRWCSKHDSCNLKIASQSIEALDKRMVK